jgi:hypothetical protein
MEALLSLMDAGSRAQYLAWEEMYEVAKREGNESRASRAESRMADLESKVFGILSSPPVVGTSSGSSSGDSAAVAASVDAVLSARAGDAAAKKTLVSLESTLDKQLSASAPVQKYQGAIALDTKSARFTQALEALMMALAASAWLPKKGVTNIIPGLSSRQLHRRSGRRYGAPESTGSSARTIECVSVVIVIVVVIPTT